ncbi:MAG: hypothetical protein KC457_26185, partial [Myxococcales bacterium]|nr:hypothetical protein [Myxococcales bacterium]
MRRRTTTALLALSLLGGGCDDSPAEVVIDTRVGQPTLGPRDDTGEDGFGPTEIAARLVLYRDIGLAWWSGELSALAGVDAEDDDEDELPEGEAKAKAKPASEDIVYEPRPPQDPEAFAALVAAVRQGPIDEIGVPLHNLAEAGPAMWPEIRELLMAERERSKREYRQVLSVIGGDVPNRYGYFELHWKKAHGYDVRLSEDWFEDLLGLPPARITKLLRPVYRDTLLTTALLRAAGDIGRTDPGLTPEVVATLLDAAYVHDGTFRDEVGRAIDRIGDQAIPSLLRESLPPEDYRGGQKADLDKSVPERRAEYATYCLDRMDRLHPQRALEAVSDNRILLAETLAAYGLLRDGEAAPLLLDHVDADPPGIRAAARAAFEAYVVGPLPTAR